MYADYNNLQSFKDAYVEGKTCAIMFEPVQGEGGVFPATDEFIQGIRKFCDEKGILFLLDRPAPDPEQPLTASRAAVFFFGILTILFAHFLLLTTQGATGFLYFRF